MNEARLIEKLRAIEALYAGALTPGEKVAAANARDRIRERLLEAEREDPAVEYQFSMPDMWSRRVFIALLRRYGVQPYRYKRQRYTTVVANVSRRFVDETLWPEFTQISRTLEAYLADVTDRVVSQVIHDDTSEVAVVDEPRRLPLTTPVAPPQPAPHVAPQPAGASGSPGHAAASADQRHDEKTKTPGRSKHRGRKNKKRKRGKGRA